MMAVDNCAVGEMSGTLYSIMGAIQNKSAIVAHMNKHKHWK